MKKQLLFGLLYIILSCFVMGYIDAVWQPGYAIKSCIKIVLFGIMPFFIVLKLTSGNFDTMFQLKWASVWRSALLGIAVYIVIVGGYILLREWIDFSNITTSLNDSVGVNARNFIFVAFYISIVNSFLEEFFFRGFSYTVLKARGPIFAYTICSILFALYHVAMMIGWYDWSIFSLAILALFGAGIVFHVLNERSGTIYTSWIVHMCSNLGINTVGFILFGII
jgi:uncharacterized protein